MIGPSVLELHHKAKQGDVRAQVRLGLTLEAGGRANEGLDWLALAARRGDVEALTLVGTRLVAGRCGPGLAAQGVGLLEDAVRAGGADAVAQLAVLDAAGMHRPQDWPRALDHLQRAAELGRREAQLELAILAGQVRAAPKPTETWGRLRDLVELAALASPPAGSELSADPRIHAYEGFASEGACRWIIRQSRPKLQRALVYDEASGTTVVARDRNNRVANFSISDTNLVILWIQQKIARAAGVALATAEGASVLCYGPGEQAGDHFDFLDPEVPAYRREIALSGQRIATCLVYLNQGYSGGTTDFPVLGLSHAPQRGGALLFSNVDPAGAVDRRTLHAGRPLLGGEKWVLSNFVRDRAYMSAPN